MCQKTYFLKFKHIFCVMAPIIVVEINENLTLLTKIMTKIIRMYRPPLFFFFFNLVTLIIVYICILCTVFGLVCQSVRMDPNSYVSVN